jgi:mRNA-degrading endonuclease HigB of HigAB toxin-antitoxin module
MNKIIAVNQRYLKHPALLDSMPQSLDLDMLSYFSNLPYEVEIPYLGLMPRAGRNDLPFCNDAIDLLGARMPEYDPGFSMSWSDVTDQRALELEKLCTDLDKDLVVQWSGGIDSTCMLSAIIKNFSSTARQRVKIACNWGSVIENPAFYHDYIQGQYVTVDINNQTRNLNDNSLVVGGEIADKISMTMGNLDQNLGVRDKDLFSLPWRSNKHRLHTYLTSVTKNPDFADWFITVVANNIESVLVPVETCFDFLWWSSFNYHWYGSILLEWLHHYRHTGQSWEQHRVKFIRWYETVDYQQWSMNNHLGSKYGTRLDSIKQQAKQYIFDLDANEWYLKYKIKISSAGRVSAATTGGPFAITDDFKVLYIDQDIDLIRQLLPTHLV